MLSEQIDKVVNYARIRGVIRPRDLDGLAVPRRYLHRLYQQGRLERITRGLYQLKGVQPSGQRTLLEVAQKVPDGVICLLSALQLHGLTTQLPHQVWIAIDIKARPPGISLPIRLVRASGQALRAGVMRKQIEGIRIKVYNPAKTVADCFKYRSKIGQDVAIEALKDCLNKKLCTVDELWKFAEICRVANVMGPYLEALI